MKFPRLLVPAASSALLLPLASAEAGEEKLVALDKVPAEIKNLAGETLQNFVIERAQIETEDDGRETYELIGVHQGAVTEIDISKSGEFEEYEKELTTKEVPFAVRKAIQKRYPGVEFKRFEASFNEHDKVFQYEVECELDGKPLDIECKPDGSGIVESDS